MFMLMLRIAVVVFVIYFILSLVSGRYAEIVMFYWWMFPGPQIP